MKKLLTIFLLVPILLIASCQDLDAECDKKCGIVRGRLIYNPTVHNFVCYCQTQTGWELPK